jgi:myo-inositol-1(or 4)-monophosphatase
MIDHPFTNPQQWETLKSGLVELANAHIVKHFKNVGFEIKNDGTLLTLADTEMQNACKTFLQQNWPEFQFLGEESSIEEQQQALNSEQGCWILDPIDGTTNFVNKIEVFAVSLGLIIQGEMVLGLTYDPMRKELFGARLGQGAELNNAPLSAPKNVQPLKQCAAIIDFKRLKPELATELAIRPPFASQRSFGSVALDWCWIAAGRGQIYLHGNQSLWDYGPGWLILNEAGGASVSLDNRPVYIKELVKRSAVAANNAEMLTLWKNYIDSFV